MNWIWWLRWLVVAVAAAFGIVLITRHHALIGALILALAVSRATLLIAVRRRRSAFRARRRGRFGPPPGHG